MGPSSTKFPVRTSRNPIAKKWHHCPDQPDHVVVRALELLCGRNVEEFGTGAGQTLAYIR